MLQRNWYKRFIQALVFPFMCEYTVHFLFCVVAAAGIVVVSIVLLR
jgi:hypothetical protein